MTTNAYLLAALALLLIYLMARSRSLGRQARDLAERLDDVTRRARDFERRYEQDLQRSREAVKIEIQSALNALSKKEAATPADPRKEAVVETLRSVYDPEIPVNVYDLGLIYDIDVKDEREVWIKMSLTSEACPSAKEIPLDIERKLKSNLSFEDVRVEVVWEPKWGPHLISDEGKKKLGLVTA